MKYRSTVTRLVPALLAAVVPLMACQEEVDEPIYQLLPVSTRDIVVSASASGVIEPIRIVEVKSKASGEIFEMRVETGDAVEAGALLVRVDPRIPQNALRQARADLDVAQASLENARSQLRRSEELYKTQSITEQEYEDAKLAAANANAQLVRAQRSLEDARISAEDTDVKAPSAGVIIQKNVEVGTVITSATQGVTGGTVLLQMADLDTVQVRALVDETDIGKVQPGLAVTITVDAYPNQPFRGDVLKIEPQAEVLQNVTMFPVLVRIPNEDTRLRPGMNTEVEIHIGNRQDVLAVPNAALRTDRDYQSAAEVLGLDFEIVRQQLADARQVRTEGGRASLGGTTAADTSGGETVTWQGREVPVPDGVTAAEINALQDKLQGGDMRAVFQSLSAKERSVLQQLRGNRAGRRGGRGPGGGGSATDNSALFGGNYIVFARRNGEPTPVPVRTGLTDLDYSEVISGLSATDSVLILPSASLIRSQQEFQERMNRVRGGGIPGVRQGS